MNFRRLYRAEPTNRHTGFGYAYLNRLGIEGGNRTHMGLSARVPIVAPDELLSGPTSTSFVTSPGAVAFYPIAG